MDEVAAGVWHWQAPHPAWNEKNKWPRIVSSYAIDDGERLLVFDPIAPPEELSQRAEARELVVVLTSAWHERDTRALVARYNPPVFFPEPDPGTPDLDWLLSGETGRPNLYTANSGLPAGVDAAFPGRQTNDFVLWIASRRTVVAGDTLVDFGDGLEIHDPWLEAISREQVVAHLLPLLDLPVERVLATHGGPQDPAALQRVLA